MLSTVKLYNIMYGKCILRTGNQSLMKRTPNIVIIDTGLAASQLKDKNRIEINRLDEGDSILDEIGHGSIVYQIVRNNAPHARIGMIKISDTDEISEDMLLRTLKDLKYEDIDIINLSMGLVISERRNELESICEEISESGTIIVSAFDNDGAMSYPAAFNSVIGVDISPKCKRINQFEYIEGDCVDIRGFSGVVNVKVGEKVYSSSGTSFACALITARIANYFLNEDTEREEILAKLKGDATIIVGDPGYEVAKTTVDINNAVIFPFNKEMYALVANQDLLCFNLTNVFDVKELGKVNKKISSYIQGDIKNDIDIEDIFHLNWDAPFDTFILGHTRELNDLVGFNFRKYVCNKCKEYGKKMYSFDDVKMDVGKNVTVPAIYEKNVPTNRYGKLYQVHCPVLGIFGTSSRQGKFTLQLKLRRQFIENGFKVAQIGTEPSSMLFGMDGVFPMGYEGIIPVKARNAIITLNDMLQRSINDETDIAIVGSQSGAGIYSLQNTALLPIENYELLLGTQPDAILLCVNACDTDDYIKRTIMTLENMIDSHVIALVVSPLKAYENNIGLRGEADLIDLERLKMFRNHLEDEFKRRSFVLNFEDDASDIYRYCVDIFREGEIADDI